MPAHSSAPKVSRSRRFLVFVVAGALLVASGYAYVAYFLVRPVGVGPAGPQIDRRAFQNVWSERGVRVVGIGDSVTAGLGARSPEHSYFLRMIRNPDDEFPDMRGVCLSAVLPNLEFENLAISGTTSLEHVEVVQKRLAHQESDVFGIVVMTTGGNDLIHNYGRTPPREGAMYGATVEQAQPWIQNFEDRLETMLDTIDERFPGGCEIYMGNIYDPTDGVGDAPSVYLPKWPDGVSIHAAYNRVITQCTDGRANVHVVPLYETFLGHGSHCRQFWRAIYDADDPYYWYYVNIEDPNDRGYDAIRRVFLRAILAHSERASSSHR